MVKGLGKILGIGLFSWLLLLPGLSAWADKVVEPLVFDATGGAIAILSFYETDPVTQADAIKSFYKTTKSFYKTIPGFYGLALFSSTDGARVVELSQWQDQASYEAFQGSLTSTGDSEGYAKADYTKYYEEYTTAKGGQGGKGKDKETVELGQPFLTRSFSVDQVVSPPGMVSAIPGTMALVQISDITTDADHSANLEAAAQIALADLSQFYPAPRTAILLTSPEANHIALLANWGSVAEFGDLDQVPQITLLKDATTDDTTDFSFTADTRLYQTVKVITPKAEKYGQG
jgi:heme-degrading monooxygenase HmoA